MHASLSNNADIGLCSAMLSIAKLGLGSLNRDEILSVATALFAMLNLVVPVLCGCLGDST